MARAQKVLLELHPHSVVDEFHGVHIRGERKLYTESEAAELLNLEYGGRPIFARVEPQKESNSEE